MTQPQFMGKVVIILAGYENDINCLIDVDPGLSSRFPETLDFTSMTPDESLAFLQQLLTGEKQIESAVSSNSSKRF